MATLTSQIGIGEKPVPLSTGKSHKRTMTGQMSHAGKARQVTTYGTNASMNTLQGSGKKAPSQIIDNRSKTGRQILLSQNSVTSGGNHATASVSKHHY